MYHQGALEKKEILKNGCISINLPVDSKNPILIYRNKNKIIIIIKKFNINIIHARSRAPAWSAYLAAKEEKVFITTFHGTYGTENFLKKKYNSVMLKGKRVIAISEFIKEHIEENYSKSNKVVVIPRGINESLLFPRECNCG